MPEAYLMWNHSDQGEVAQLSSILHYDLNTTGYNLLSRKGISGRNQKTYHSGLQTYGLMDKKPVRGMLTLPELQAKVEVGEIETIVTVFSDLYGRLFGKRITPEFFLEHTAKLGMNACNYLMTVDMEMDPVPGYKYASWELGYGDFHCMPDLETLRVASWLDKSALVICDVGDESTHELVSIAPRSILKKQIAAAAEMGYMAQGASELEYFIFDETYASAILSLTRRMPVPEASIMPI